MQFTDVPTIQVPQVQPLVDEGWMLLDVRTNEEWASGRIPGAVHIPMDQLMARMQVADEKAKAYGGCGPRLNQPRDPSYWFSKGGAPWPKLDNEKPKGETVDYDELVKRWKS